MHIHILGICGTFMGGLAMLARQMGMTVTGSDQNVYPPMSTQLAQQGIGLIEGFDPQQLKPAPDMVIIGNALSRGNPCVEYILDKGLAYCSGAQWLAEHVLHERWVLAVAGTHGKTTTSSMLAWILEDNGMSPGYLIGGVPGNFGVSARLGGSPFFVVEADEYDSAFFDKRSKFVHYKPRTLVLNNLEFDHADIFDDLAAIQRQFHHLLRTVPASGRIIAPEHNEAIAEVLAQGCWSELERSGAEQEWQWQALRDDCSQLNILFKGQSHGLLQWDLIGEHNAQNALMAIAAARHVGVLPSLAIDSLSRFVAPKRRMELLGECNGVSVYDDFAHHPSAIATTLQGLRAKVGDAPIIAVVEARSNTMKMGVMAAKLPQALALANHAYLFQDTPSDSLVEAVKQLDAGALYQDSEALLDTLKAQASAGTHIVIMSNGGFAGFHQRLLRKLGC